MSLAFNDTTNFKGIVQIYEKEIGVDRGYISGNTNRLKEFAADVNLTWDDYLSIALPASGTWQYDDSNHSSHYPIVYTDLVQNQQDYTIVTDEDGALVLDIYKVGILESATDTTYTELDAVDQQSKGRGYDIFEESSSTSAPFEYDKTANGIILNPTPDYNATNGLKVMINREPSYFISTDTTKKPGCPGIHHRYFALKPALDFARRNNLKNYNRLREEVVSFEGDGEKNIVGSIAKYFGKREKDKRPIMSMKKIKYI